MSDLFDGIRASYLAHGLSDSEVEAIAALASEVRCADGEEIIREYDRATDLYLLLEGKVRVTSAVGEPIARLQAGTILGEISLVDNGPRSATVVSEGATRLIRIPADQFEALMDGQPKIGLAVLRNLGKTLCARLRSANVQLESLIAAM